MADLTFDCDKKKVHTPQQSDRIFRKNICKSNEQMLVNTLLAEDDDDEVLQEGQGQVASEQQFSKKCEARRMNKLKSKRNYNDQDSVNLGNDRNLRDIQSSKVGDFSKNDRDEDASVCMM